MNKPSLDYSRLKVFPYWFCTPFMLETLKRMAAGRVERFNKKTVRALRERGLICNYKLFKLTKFGERYLVSLNEEPVGLLDWAAHVRLSSTIPYLGILSQR